MKIFLYSRVSTCLCTPTLHTCDSPARLLFLPALSLSQKNRWTQILKNDSTRNAIISNMASFKNNMTRFFVPRNDAWHLRWKYLDFPFSKWTLLKDVFILNYIGPWGCAHLITGIIREQQKRRPSCKKKTFETDACIYIGQPTFLSITNYPTGTL